MDRRVIYLSTAALGISPKKHGTEHERRLFCTIKILRITGVNVQKRDVEKEPKSLYKILDKWKK